MSQILRQSSAWATSIGPVLDSAGAEYTGLVIGDLTLGKNGTEAAMASAATLTHVSNGHYDLVGTTGNVDTVGRIRIRCNKSTYQFPPVEFQVVEEAVYDAVYASGATGKLPATLAAADVSGNLPANVIQINSQTASAAGTVTFPATIASTTNITAGTITTVTNLTNAPTNGDLTATMKASVLDAIVDDATRIDASAVNSITTNWDGENLTALPWNAGLAAGVNAEVDTALADINLDHLMKVAVTNGDVIDNSALAKLASKSATASWASYNNQNNSLEAGTEANTVGNVSNGGTGTINLAGLSIVANSDSIPAITIFNINANGTAVSINGGLVALDLTDASGTTLVGEAIALILADTGTDGVVLSAETKNAIADHVRRRTQANVEASMDGDALSIGSEYGFIQTAQESNTMAHAGKLTTFKTDGTTELAQKTITTDAAAEPITGIS